MYVTQAISSTLEPYLIYIYTVSHAILGQHAQRFCSLLGEVCEPSEIHAGYIAPTKLQSMSQSHDAAM